MLSLAVKGFLQIDDKRSDGYLLIKNQDLPNTKLPQSERILIDGLFKARNKVKIGGKYDPKVSHMRNMYEEKLVKDYANKAHIDHTYSFFFGAAIGTLGLLLLFFDQLESLLIPAFFSLHSA